MYLLFAIFTGIICLGLFIWAFRLLFSKVWILGWLRGTFGLFLIVVVIGLAFISFDIASYKQLIAEKDIATIDFKKLGQQHYLATFTHNELGTKEYELFGDQWQLDSRVFKWSPAALKLGFETGYRLDRLSGRYLSLQDERSLPRQVYAFPSNKYGIDLWLWVNALDTRIGFVDARFGSGVFLPMVDQGRYQISLTTNGLIARPLNQSAEEAVAFWQ